MIASWIYPHLDRITPFWFPAAAAVEIGVFVLMIPPQTEGFKYFVVRELDRPDGTSQALSAFRFGKVTSSLGCAQKCFMP